MPTAPKITTPGSTGRVFLFVFAASLTLWGAAWHTPVSHSAAEPAADVDSGHDKMAQPAQAPRG